MCLDELMGGFNVSRWNSLWALGEKGGDGVCGGAVQAKLTWGDAMPMQRISRVYVCVIEFVLYDFPLFFG